MKVPFLDLTAVYKELKDEVDDAINRVLSSGLYILGPEVEKFEEKFARYCSSKHCIGVANGLDALELSLRAAKIGPSDEVIVPTNTFVATWIAVSRVGGTIVPVEPDPNTYNIDPNRIEDAISDKTRAIIPVHLYGQPADMKLILNVARQHNLFVIEDAAQAHGAVCRGQKVGSLGDLACWSFYPGKNLGAVGDAGAVTTSNNDFANKLRALRNYGFQTKYKSDVIGSNSRLDPIQAAVLCVKIKYLDSWTDRRRLIANRYLKELKKVKLPFSPEWACPVWHQFVILHDKRDQLQNHLCNEQIDTLIHYPIPPHLQKSYANYKVASSQFSIAEELARNCLSLPINPHLSDSFQSKVIDEINNFSTQATGN